MRIVSGEFKGRRLISPPDYEIRPTGDKVKEAVFSIIMPYTDAGFKAVDLFAGSGSMGLEAISRGASMVYFSDAARSSIALIKENISLCGASDRAFVLSGDFRNNIRRIKDEIDVYFIDPPYADGYIVPALEEIRSSGNLKPGGLVICEHSPKEHLPEFIEGYQLLKTRTYGASSVSVYEKTEE